MSVRQAILNTSGFFSITSLEHKACAQRRGQSGTRRAGLRAARPSGGSKKGLEKQKGFCALREPHHKAPGGQAAPLLPPMSSTLHQGGHLKAAAAPRVEMGVWGGNATPRGAAQGKREQVPVESREEAAGGKQDGALGEGTALLIDPLEVAFGDVCHADGPG